MYLAFERYRKEEKHNKYFYILIYIYIIVVIFCWKYMVLKNFSCHLPYYRKDKRKVEDMIHLKIKFVIFGWNVLYISHVNSFFVTEIIIKYNLFHWLLNLFLLYTKYKHYIENILITQITTMVRSSHLEPDILESEVKWALRSITMNKDHGNNGIPAEL